MKKIMIVDDSAFMRSIIRKIVEKIGCEVVTEAENGKEAVEMYKIHRPDLVTMDITMPEMDGLQALSEILSIDACAKVVMATAMGQDEMVKESIKRGAKDFLAKPFSAEEVERIINGIGV